MIGSWGGSEYTIPSNVTGSNAKSYEISQTDKIAKNSNNQNLFDATPRDVVKLTNTEQNDKQARFADFSTYYYGPYVRLCTNF